MAIHTIANNCLVVSVSDHGAELQSIKTSDGKEYLWQGDPAFWARRSPLLFPFVGAVKNNSYQYQDTAYPMGQHGFARDMDFAFLEKEGTKLSFRLTANDETRAVYPFDFALTVSYALFNNEIRVTWTVENNDSKVMYYSIGAHPAFLLPEKYSREECYISMDKVPQRITAISGKYAVEGSNVKDRLSLGASPFIRLEKDLFASDALVIEDSQLHKVGLCTPDREPFVEVSFDAPVVGIWSPDKEGCPFVCIEPWYGRCDAVDFEGTLEERKWQNSLPPAGSATHAYRITIC